MIRRLLLVTSALMLSWVGVVDLGVGTQASPVEFVYVYAHDGHHQPAILTFTITERRPPTTYDSDTAAHTYDGPPLLSAPSATATYARESLSQPGAASWVSPASVRDRGDAAETAEVAAGGARQVTVLGRYTGGVDSYVGKPGFNTLNLPFKGAGRWNWTRNKRFIDGAIERGDEIRLVTNPNEPLYQGGNTFQRELRYLQDRGYTWQEQGDYWNAVPR